MGFGNKVTFARAGDFTGGAEAVPVATVMFDANGQARYSAQRNHPRVVQEPVGVLHFSANCDMQLLMSNAKSFELAQYGDLPYANVAGMSGIEQFSARSTCVEYTVGCIHAKAPKMLGNGTRF
jgi:hypothetical protein